MSKFVTLICGACKKPTTYPINRVDRLEPDGTDAYFNALEVGGKYFIMSPCCRRNDIVSTPELLKLYEDQKFILKVRKSTG